MSKAIKIIDLLNKIANGERLPERIIYKNTVFELNEFENYINKEDDDILLDYLLPTFKNICDEVEILEDNTEEIEELGYRDTNYFNMLSEEAKVKWLFKYIQEDEDKINELVRAVNQIRKEKE